MSQSGRLVLAAVLLATPAPDVRAQAALEADVLVVGGGTGGTAAALQSARLGARTIVAEPTPWLGGMLSAAGVSATDGNHRLPSGLWREFRQRIYAHYGGPEAVSTGWVSNTHFEPHVADRIFKEMAAAEPSLRVLFRHRFVDVVKDGSRVRGAVLEDLATGRRVEVRAKVVVDGTDLGDVLARAGAAFDLGLEADSVSGENAGIAASSDVVQDLTWCAILKDYGPGADRTIPRPAGYDPAEFDCSSTSYCKDATREKPTVDARKMLDYARLPGGKYLVNWPNHGNDTYLNVVGMDDGAREKALAAAKATTLRFVYFIQHELGFREPGARRRRVPDEGPPAPRPLPPRGPSPAGRRPLQRARHRGSLRRARPALPDGRLGGGLPDRPPPQAQPAGAPAPVVRSRALVLGAARSAPPGGDGRPRRGRQGDLRQQRGERHDAAAAGRPADRAGRRSAGRPRRPRRPGAPGRARARGPARAARSRRLPPALPRRAPGPPAVRPHPARRAPPASSRGGACPTSGPTRPGSTRTSRSTPRRCRRDSWSSSPSPFHPRMAGPSPLARLWRW